jgi:hypothetical protein
MDIFMLGLLQMSLQGQGQFPVIINMPINRKSTLKYRSQVG